MSQIKNWLISSIEKMNNWFTKHLWIGLGWAFFCFIFVFLGSLWTMVHFRKFKLPSVQASLETDPIVNWKNTAGDVNLWLHPQDLSLSLILGCDQDKGLLSYDLKGTLHQYVPMGRVTRIDLRYNFLFQGKKISIIAVGNRSKQTVDFFTIDPVQRQLTNIGSVALPYDSEVLCTAFSQRDQCYYLFAVPTKSNQVYQYLIEVNHIDELILKEIRKLSFPAEITAIIGDDELSKLYILIPQLGIWETSLDPGIQEQGQTLIISQKKYPYLFRDSVDFTLYRMQGGQGYLLVSSPSKGILSIFERAIPHHYIGAFRIQTGNYDRVTGCRYIHVNNLPLGPFFPTGMLIIHDEKNEDGERQTFKSVHWGDIVSLFPEKLQIDLKYDLRLLGKRNL